MNTVSVDKAELIEKVKANAVAHVEQYAKAIEKYYERLAEWHTEQATLAASRVDPERYSTLPKPENHTKDYEESLAMLHWEQRHTIDLDQQAFRQLVLNEWGWSEKFNTSISAYIAS